MRRIIHYGAAAVIIPIYGVQVCPFVEGLPAFSVIIPIVTLFAVQYLAGKLLWDSLVNKKPLNSQVRSAFRVELLLFLATGISLTIFNTVTFSFPLESGLKLIVGIAGLGFFAAIDIALQVERNVAATVLANHTEIEPEEDYFPITTRMVIFATISVLLIVGIFILLVIKDLDWLVKVGNDIPLADGRVSIIKEFLFVLSVTLPHTLNVIFSFARNIRSSFDAQNALLLQTTLGDYSGSIPVASADEFGVMAKHTNRMVDTIRERTEELGRTRDITIMSLASLAETRDNETGAHLLRTQRYVRALAKKLKDHPRFCDFLDIETIDLLFKSAPLHDIGKVGIPDAILLKPGKLTDDEFEIMKGHPAIGAEALAVAQKGLGPNSFLILASDISLTHHEKWDGSGYPAGLKGDEIPFSGRLMAVADVYDALISKRVYKPAFSHEKACKIIIEGKGTHFDPDIVDAFVAIEDEFCDIARQYGDENTN
ncbi:HD domain-containing protein [Mariprofundus ferrinatatus]|uniref:HD domain-containing protein n=1 Tax=Mariprofundus ferrinatatus TaxID=1921087 RepID=A0A2K8L235_9PROT|nr:HD domain-containing phosphohydrolase [Mariprofundus ferrinatatus]ATX81390.1 HD domain-containing protein [Mariprofundus ferrinatatus]